MISTSSRVKQHTKCLSYSAASCKLVILITAVVVPTVVFGSIRQGTTICGGGGGGAAIHSYCRRRQRSRVILPSIANLNQPGRKTFYVPRGGDQEEDGDNSYDVEEDDNDDDEEKKKGGSLEVDEYDDEDSDAYEEYSDEEEEEEEESNEGDAANDGEAVADYDEPLVPSPMLQMYCTFGVILLSKRVDLFHPTVVRIARFAFIGYLIIHQIFLLFVRVRAKMINDRTPISLSNPINSLLQSQLGKGGEENGSSSSGMVKNLASSFLSSKSTIVEYDLKQAKSMQGGLLMNMCFMWFLHFKMEQVQPLLIQSVTGMSNMIYHPLFQVYVMGRNLERPFKNPAATTTAAAAEEEEEPEQEEEEDTTTKKLDKTEEKENDNDTEDDKEDEDSGEKDDNKDDSDSDSSSDDD